MAVTAMTRTVDIAGQSYRSERGALWRGIVAKYGVW